MKIKNVILLMTLSLIILACSCCHIAKNSNSYKIVFHSVDYRGKDIGNDFKFTFNSESMEMNNLKFKLNNGSNNIIKKNIFPSISPAVQKNKLLLSVSGAEIDRWDSNDRFSFPIELHCGMNEKVIYVNEQYHTFSGKIPFEKSEDYAILTFRFEVEKR